MPFDRLYGTQLIQRSAQGIDHPTQQAGSHRHIQYASGTVDLGARHDPLALPQQYHPYPIGVEVEGDPQNTAGESYQLLGLHAGQAFYPGDIATDKIHHADLLGGDVCPLPGQHLVQRLFGLLEQFIQHGLHAPSPLADGAVNWVARAFDNVASRLPR